MRTKGRPIIMVNPRRGGNLEVEKIHGFMEYMETEQKLSPIKKNNSVLSVPSVPESFSNLISSC